MKSVALYGFASATREGIWESKADEIWSIVWAYKYNLPRIDRLLEIHPTWMQAASKKREFEKVRDHWAWLKANTEIPVYMIEKRPEVPRSICYPIEDVQALVPPQRREKVFTSSFDYLMGLAILEGFKRIEIYGFEMGSDTEYRYQREGAAYWIGYCDAAGIELIQPKGSILLRSKMYGMGAGSMIYRQDMERMRATREKQKVEAFARLSNLEGRLQIITEQMVAAEKNGNQEKKAEFEVLQKEAANKWDEQYRLCLVISGALQECEYLLSEIDLEEPSEELIDPIGFIPMN